MTHMAITDADRDASGRIVVERPAVERTLADLLPTAQGAELTGAKPWRPGRLELAASAAGLLLAVALIAAMNAFWPAPAQGTRYPVQPTPAPMATPAPSPAPMPPQQSAYAAPGGALLGTIPQTATLAYQHSAWPGWAGVAHDGGIVWIETDRPLAGLPDLAPPPTQAPRPPSIPASAPAIAPAAPAEAPCDPQINPRYTSPLLVDPIGSVTGVSCISQAEADANAMQLAEAMRRAADEPTPTVSAR